jgi:type II secretory pathway predicted ATPase ExeA
MPDATAKMAPVAAAATAPANYLDLYGLSKPPFGDSSDAAGYILFASHRRPFELLTDHMVNGNGLVILSGESGAGKSQMLRAAGNVVAESGVPAIRVSRPPGGRVDLTTLVAALLSYSDPNLPAADTIQTVLRPPHKALLIDDLDLLPTDCLQLIARLLRPSAEPGGVAIVGTATMDLSPGIARPDLAELSRTARASVRLPRLGPAEARQYIERSLWIAGGTTRRLITPDALKLVVARSHGLPDAINRQMEAAFTAGFARGDPVITVKTLAATAGPARQRPEVPVPRQPGPASWLIPVAAAGVLAIGIAAFLYKGLYHGAEADHVAVARPAPQPPGTTPPPVPALPPPPANAVFHAEAQPPPAPVKPLETLAPDLMAALMKRGEQSLSLGDIAAARLLFKRAAEAGNARAAVAMGKTYDSDALAAGPAQGEGPDPAVAAEWYARAAALGDPQAPDLLARLKSRSPAGRP